jgi:hypothetical protein
MLTVWQVAVAVVLLFYIYCDVFLCCDALVFPLLLMNIYLIMHNQSMVPAFVCCVQACHLYAITPIEYIRSAVQRQQAYKT